MCRMKDAKMEYNEKCVRFVGDSKHPKWALTNTPGANYDKHKIFGNVSCPCENESGKLSEHEALARIMGQVAALGVQDAKWYTKNPSWGVHWNSVVALSVVKMLKCWEKLCSADLGEELEFSQLAAGRPVNLQLGDSFGGGSYC